MTGENELKVSPDVACVTDHEEFKKAVKQMLDPFQEPARSVNV